MTENHDKSNPGVFRSAGGIFILGAVGFVIGWLIGVLAGIVIIFATPWPLLPFSLASYESVLIPAVLIGAACGAWALGPGTW